MTPDDAVVALCIIPVVCAFLLLVGAAVAAGRGTP